MSEETIEEQFIVLNFKDKVDQSFFERPNMFFKIVNLHTKTPLIQIGNNVFNGTYDTTSLGTTLLFKESEEQVVPNYCDEPSQINLKCSGKTTKVLSLQWQKVPEEIVNIEPQDLKRIDFKDDYATVLKKIGNQTLELSYVIDPLVTTNENSEPVKVVEEDKEKLDALPRSKNKIIKLYTEDRYNALKHAVSGHVYPPEYYEKYDSNMKTSKDYFILKELFLKSLDYKNILLNVNEDNIADFVDIETSIRDKIIDEKAVDDLTDLDKQHLISLKNFDNLSIPMKLTLLIEHLQEEKKHLAEMSREELSVTDEFDRTPKDRYRLLKALAKDLQYYMFIRISEDQLDK